MTKSQNITDPQSCWNKAREDQEIFILIEHDEAYPNTVRRWANERIDLGLNNWGDAKIRSALASADLVEAKLRNKNGGSDTHVES